MLDIRLNRNGSELVVALDGRLDTMTARELEEKLSPALEGVNSLLLD